MLTHLTGHKFPLWSDHNELKHQKVWDLIFDNYEFLEYISECGYLCVLLGSDLQYLYNYNSKKALHERSLKDNKDLNLALVFLRGDPNSKSSSYILSTRQIIEGFSNSAKKELKEKIDISYPRWIVPGTLKIRHCFAKGEYCTIRLNIESLSELSGSPSTKLDTCETLVSLEGDYLNSAYLYWKYDGKLLRLIEPTDIVGVGRYASVRGTKEWVKDVCGLKIQHPAEVPELCSHQRPCIPSFEKRPERWWLVRDSFKEGVFPCQIRFYKGLLVFPPYKARHELFIN
jgi:hypothetical protein